MINNKIEYEYTLTRIHEQKQRLIEYSQSWEKEGYSKEEIKKLLEPLESFYMGLVEEANCYINKEKE
jgi:hypothetical protein